MYKIPANLGFPSNLVHYLPTCHSTNEIAVNLLGSGLDEGSLIITDNQTAGTGQPGNSWESKPYNNLTFSLVLRPSFLELKKQFRLTQAISISLANQVQEYVSGVVKIKWPNDIYIGDRKVAGILIQNSVKNKSFEASIVGIGLNVNQDEFETPRAVSLKIASGKTYDLNAVLVDLVESISAGYNELKTGIYSRLNEEYQDLLYARNKPGLFESDERFTGEIIGTDQIGRLMIQTANGVKCFQNQEVKLIRV